MSNDDQQYFTRREAADYLRCSLRSLDIFLSSNDLKSYRVGKRKILLARDDLDRFARRRTTRADLDAIVSETLAELRK